MLYTHSLYALVNVSAQELQSALLEAFSQGWTPALLESSREFARLAGVDGKVLPPVRRPRPTYYGDTRVGDVFFQDDGVYYVTLAMTRREYLEYVEGRIVAYNPRNRDRMPPESELRVGVISPTLDDIESRLGRFASVVETCLKQVKSVEDRRVEIGWEEREASSPLAKLTAVKEEEASVRFEPACLNREEIDAAQTLASKPAREMLIEISQAGFVRERDMLARKSKSQADVKESIDQLKRSGLVRSEHLLECRRANTPLTRLSDPSQLRDTDIGNLPCPSCGTPFRKELVSEGYSLSDLGQQMSRRSYWMTVWITDLLVKLGVGLESILWNVTDMGEEVDLLVEYLGEIWIFELKAREFGPGDAHPFNYRRVRYKANRGIIVTTEKVSREAKIVFEELAREAQRAETRGWSGVFYVEGLDAAEISLRKEISAASFSFALRRLNPIEELSGYRLEPILAARFNEDFVSNTSSSDLETYYSDAELFAVAE